jgi:hypothetical protein
MANWVAANFQVIGGFFHFLVILRNAKKISLEAASSLGKCPRFLSTLRGGMCRLSIALCEVSFAEWTDDEQMRQTTFLVLRGDKDPKEVVRERLTFRKSRAVYSGRIPTTVNTWAINLGKKYIKKPRRSASKTTRQHMRSGR